MAISSALQFPDAIKNLGIEPEDFSDPLMVEIARTAQRIDYRGDKGEVPFADIEALLGREKIKEQIGFVPIASYDQAAKWLVNLREYSTASTLDYQIHELWSCEYGESPGSDRVEALRSILASAQVDAVSSDVQGLDSITKGFIGSTREAIHNHETQSIRTGLPLTDRFIRGFRPGELTYMVSDAGSGKSTLLAYILRKIAQQGKNVLLFSGEMSEAQLGEREAASLIGKNLSTEWESEEELNRAERILAQADYVNRIKVDTNPSPTLAEVEGKIRRLISTEGISFFAFDHIEHLTFRESLPDNERYKRAIMGLKALLKIYRLPGMVIGHINRDGERGAHGEENPVPNKSWVRGSTHLTAVPDNVVIPLRRGMTNEVDCYVLKARMGLTGRCTLLYNTNYSSYSEV